MSLVPAQPGHGHGLLPSTALGSDLVRHGRGADPLPPPTGDAIPEDVGREASCPLVGEPLLAIAVDRSLTVEMVLV